MQRKRRQSEKQGLAGRKKHLSKVWETETGGLIDLTELKGENKIVKSN